VNDLRFELLAEENLPPEKRAAAGELLAECFDLPDTRERGWILHPPMYRVLVWDGDALVGQEMGCRVACDPPIDLHGLGDAAVQEKWRRRGVADRMGALLHEEAIRRDADAVLCATGQLNRIVLEHGMEPVRPGEVYLRRRFRRNIPLGKGWYIRWHSEKVVPLKIDQKF
jgi:GNAT superfamily N-acetyltransferase